MKTEIIPTKFPEADVNFMDKLIRNGIFISRSDLIREATREKMRESLEKESDLDLLIKEMKKKGDFDCVEGRVLARLYFEAGLKDENFNQTEQIVVRRLLRHPFKILERKKGFILLTENGKSVARGYLKGLAFSRAM